MENHRCTECATRIEELEQDSSLACCYQHGVLEALKQLRDGYEAQQIDEVIEAAGALIAAISSNIADGEISLAERRELRVLGEQLRREIRDVRDYDAHENAAHGQAGEHQQRARHHAARTQRALDAAVRAFNHRREGGRRGKQPWLGATTAGRR